MSYQALLFCPDEKTARVVTQVLSELDFAVEPCNEPFAAVKKLMAQHFDALVVDCENEQNAGLLFKSARNSGSNQNSLSVAVVEGQAGVAKAFRIGANLVLTKPINVEQSKGTLRVARGLLRKAEAGKSAAATASMPEVSAPAFSPSHSTTSATTAKPAFMSAAAPKIAQPVASAAGLETETEPSPAPGPSEGAFLESIHDATPISHPSPEPDTYAGKKKEYPWQPVSKAAEPMASALQRAAEATGKITTPEPTFDRPSFSTGAAQSPADEEHPAAMQASSKGAATAPAPAKQPVAAKAAPLAPVGSFAPASGKQGILKPAAMASAPAVESPTFSALAVKDHESFEEGGSSKKPMMLATVAILAIAGGYFGWTKLHPTGSKTAITQPAGVVQPQVSGPAATASPAAPVDATGGTSMQSTTPAQIAVLPSAKPSAEVKPPHTDLAPDTTTKVTQSPKTDKPILVKASPAAESRSSASQAAIAPPMLGGDSGSTTNQIAGLVSSTPLAVPKAPVQMLRVSQGVSQGLLVKRVQPSYPAQALQMRVQGTVLLEASIAKDGAVTNVKAVNGDPILARSAIAAVRQWKYKPYLLDGEPVEIQTQITVNFNLP